MPLSKAILLLITAYNQYPYARLSKTIALGICSCSEERREHRFNEGKNCLTFVRKYGESQGGTGSKKGG